MSDSETRVLLVRHAESRPDPAVLEPDWPLSEKGATQAEKLTQHLRGQGIAAVYSSPYRRAIDTVRPFARFAGLEIQIERDIRERRLVAEYRDDIPALLRRAWDDLGFAVPGCESGLECQARVRKCVDQLARSNLGRTIAVASHGNAIALYLNSLDATFGYEGWSAMRNPDVFSIRYLAGGHPVWETSGG